MSFCYVLVYSFPLCFLNILTICLYRHLYLHVHLVQVVKRNHHGEYWHQTKAIPRLIRQICCRFETELLQFSGPKRKSEVLRSTDTSGDVTPSSTLGALTARHVRIRWLPHTHPGINRQSGDLTGTVSHTHEVQLPSLNWTDNRAAILEVYLMSAVVSENSVLFDQCIISHAAVHKFTMLHCCSTLYLQHGGGSCCIESTTSLPLSSECIGHRSIATSFYSGI